MQVTEIPELLGDYLGVPTATAQVILSLVVFLMVLLPVMLLSRGKKSITVELVTIFLAECALVGIGWLPFWVLVMTAIIVALLWSKLGADLIGGD